MRGQRKKVADGTTPVSYTEHLFQIPNKSGAIKNRKSSDFSHLSDMIVLIEQMSNSFLDDLKLLARLAG